MARILTAEMVMEIADIIMESHEKVMELHFQAFVGTLPLNKPT